MSADEKRIREFAYQIWESEGKPEGQEERHWEMGRKLAQAEALAPKANPRKSVAGKDGAASDTRAKPAAKPAAKAAAKPAASKARAAKPASTASAASAKPGAAKKPRASQQPPTS
ncbi:DUF2934 domain-containing protein [Pseudomonas sp. R5(2019)]|uniref:DUF2934 domain-containing protein n=1 Tax=Pseudomonas sp. R5(2019) TaxID=2697566 RepID=UPI001411F864|nr:DUF2934 domain-containing protein [Pseudomonas sp. R5(2019)]NBA93374.1 DUF2934 domain-containing protein [Pseudomonas sp. R5(2019)]